MKINTDTSQQIPETPDEALNATHSDCQHPKSLNLCELKSDLSPLVDFLSQRGRKVERVRYDADGERVVEFRTQCFNPAHGDDGYDENPSLHVKLCDGKVLVHCFVCGDERQHDVYRHFVAFVSNGADDASVVHNAGSLHTAYNANDHANGNANGNGIATTTYEIRERDGSLVALHIRREHPDGKKTFAWQQPDGTLGLGTHKVSDLPLYCIHKLQPNCDVVVTEGEKACDALWSVGVQAVATYGANATPTLRRLRELVDIVGNGRILLWYDNDREGRVHMQRISDALIDELGFANVWFVDWKEAPEKGDAADAVAMGVDIAALLNNAKQAIPQLTTAATLIEAIGTHTTEWVVGDLLAKGDVALLSARPKTAKSLVALNIAACVASGAEFLEFPTQQGKVLFLAFERRDLTLKRAIALGEDNNPNLLFWDCVNFGSQPRISELKTLERAIKFKGISLVVVDTLIHFLRPALENAKGNLNAYDVVYEAFDAIKAVAERTGCAFLFIHHDRKGEHNEEQGVLGSTAITGAVDVVMQLQAETSRVLKMSIVGNRIESKVVWFAIDDGLRVEPAEEPAVTDEERARRVVLRELYRAGSEGLRREALIAIVKNELRKETPTAAKNLTERALRELHESGYVDTPKRGVYVLTEDGKHEAERFATEKASKHHPIGIDANDASRGMHQKHQKHHDAFDANDASVGMHQKHQTLYSDALMLSHPQHATAQPDAVASPAGDANPLACERCGRLTRVWIGSEWVCLDCDMEAEPTAEHRKATPAGSPAASPTQPEHAAFNQMHSVSRHASASQSTIATQPKSHNALPNHVNCDNTGDGDGCGGDDGGGLALLCYCTNRDFEVFPNLGAHIEQKPENYGYNGYTVTHSSFRNHTHAMPICPHCGSDDVAFAKDAWVCISCGEAFASQQPPTPSQPDGDDDGDDDGCGGDGRRGGAGGDDGGGVGGVCTPHNEGIANDAGGSHASHIPTQQHTPPQPQPTHSVGSREQTPSQDADCGFANADFDFEDAWLLDDWFRKPKIPPKIAKNRGENWGVFCTQHKNDRLGGDLVHNARESPQPEPAAEPAADALADARADADAKTQMQIATPQYAPLTAREPDGTIILRFENKTETCKPSDLEGWRDWDGINDIEIPNVTLTTPPTVVLDIECEGLQRSGDGELNLKTGKLLAIGLLFATEENTEVKILRSDAYESEKELLHAAFSKIANFAKHNPNAILTGYNLLGFDLPYIIHKAEALGVRCPFWFLDENANAKQAVAGTQGTLKGEPLQFRVVKNELGLQIVDTLHLVCRWDFVAKELQHYDLKSVAQHFGCCEPNRVVLSADEIAEAFRTRPAEFAAYLEGDLHECYRVFKRLVLPYIAIAQLTKLPIADVCVKSTAWIWERILERYYRTAEHNTEPPQPDAKRSYEGGLVLARRGLFYPCCKLDVASLYPTIMLSYRIHSRKDTQQIALRWLKTLTTERLKWKALAKRGDERADAIQQAMKILINSLYGFYGTGGYRYNDMEAAERVTTLGRKVLVAMINAIESVGGVVVEADTDGVVVMHAEPEVVLRAAQSALPKPFKLEIEWEGCIAFVSDEKNYIVLRPDGTPIQIKGSKWRGRDKPKFQTEFVPTFLCKYATEGKEAALAYADGVRSEIASGAGWDWVVVTRRVGRGDADKFLKRAGFREGERVTFAYRNAKRKEIATNPADGYDVAYYLRKFEEVLSEVCEAIGGDAQ